MKKIHRTSGQGSVEFALVVPLILLISVMFIDLGRVIYYHSALTNAVREGARHAIVTQFPSATQREQGIQQAVVQYSVALPLQLSDVTVYCERNPAKLVKDQADPCAEYVTVSAHMEVDPMVAVFAWVIGGNTYSITAESTMQMTPYGSDT